MKHVEENVKTTERYSLRMEHCKKVQKIAMKLSFLS